MRFRKNISSEARGLKMVFMIINYIVIAIPAIILRFLQIGFYPGSAAADSNIDYLIAILGSSTILIGQKNHVNIKPRKDRGRFEIISDILAVVKENGKPKKTRIMQRACLNWDTFQKYFDSLLDEGFVARCETESYELTEKGKELLRRLNAVNEMLDNELNIDLHRPSNGSITVAETSIRENV